MLTALLAKFLLPALLPAAADGVRGLFARFTGSEGAKPQNVDEAIRLMEANTNRIQAIANLDKPSGNASRWVYDLRESARYIAVYLIFLYGGLVTALSTNPDVVATAQTLMAQAFAFLFGDRVYVNLKRKAGG